jgi:hypothetical protein
MVEKGGLWQAAYMSAVLEVDGKSTPERISRARLVMAGRMSEVSGGTVNEEEQKQIENALNCLNALEVESRDWPSMAA